jgi:hypothetical protein
MAALAATTAPTRSIATNTHLQVSITILRHLQVAQKPSTRRLLRSAMRMEPRLGMLFRQHRDEPIRRNQLVDRSATTCPDAATDPVQIIAADVDRLR